MDENDVVLLLLRLQLENSTLEDRLFQIKRLEECEINR